MSKDGAIMDFFPGYVVRGGKFYDAHDPELPLLRYAVTDCGSRYDAPGMRITEGELGGIVAARSVSFESDDREEALSKAAEEWKRGRQGVVMIDRQDSDDIVSGYDAHCALRGFR